MKYIILGLGSFGGSLAQKLTVEGNEVIGIDSSMQKVEAYKEVISHTICMDATDELAVKGLPLQDTDVVIIAIGEDQGVNVMATALFKNLGVKRLISRAINPLQLKVLHAIDVDEIADPEEESAERWAKKLCFGNVLDSFELNKDASIIETTIPLSFVGKTLGELDLRNRYNVVALTTIKQKEVSVKFGKVYTEKHVQKVSSLDTMLEENDILVVFGDNKDLRKFLTANK